MIAWIRRLWNRRLDYPSCRTGACQYAHDVGRPMDHCAPSCMLRGPKNLARRTWEIES